MILFNRIQFVDFGRMVDQPAGVFGKKMIGVDNVKQMVAQCADEYFVNFEDSQSSTVCLKERFIVTSVMGGVGIDKSTFLQNHINILREYCTNTSLQKLLLEENQPLELNITFGSSTLYDINELEESGYCILARRLLSSYFDIPWEKVVTLPMDIFNVMEIIVKNHKKVNHIDNTTNIVIIINIDELNQIHHTNLLRANYVISELVRGLRSQTMNGVRGSPVIGLLASSAISEYRQSVIGKSIFNVEYTLPLIKPYDVIKLFHECGVNKLYFEDPKFIQLLNESGGVPSILRIIFEKLSLKYDHISIVNARNNVKLYLSSIPIPNLSNDALVSLLETVVLGKSILLKSFISFVPNLWYADMQKTGRLWINPHNESSYQVIVPILTLERLCQQDPNSSVADSILNILTEIKSEKEDKFKRICAEYHAFKMDRISKKSKTRISKISLGEFYGNIEMHSDTATLEIQLDSEKCYDVKYFTSKFPGYMNESSMKLEYSCKLVIRKNNVEYI